MKQSILIIFFILLSVTNEVDAQVKGLWSYNDDRIQASYINEDGSGWVRELDFSKLPSATELLTMDQYQLNQVAEQWLESAMIIENLDPIANLDELENQYDFTTEEINGEKNLLNSVKYQSLVQFVSKALNQYFIDVELAKKSGLKKPITLLSSRSIATKAYQASGSASSSTLSSVGQLSKLGLSLAGKTVGKFFAVVTIASGVVDVADHGVAKGVAKTVDDTLWNAPSKIIEYTKEKVKDKINEHGKKKRKEAKGNPHRMYPSFFRYLFHPG